MKWYTDTAFSPICTKGIDPRVPWAAQCGWVRFRLRPDFGRIAQRFQCWIEAARLELRVGVGRVNRFAHRTVLRRRGKLVRRCSPCLKKCRRVLESECLHLSESFSISLGVCSWIMTVLLHFVPQAAVSGSQEGGSCPRRTVSCHSPGQDIKNGRSNLRL